MKSLINEYVEHKKFGKGLIIDEETGKITVKFESQFGNKVFQFPDAFKQFLKFDNESLQEESLILVQAKIQQIAEENERKRIEYEQLEEQRKKEEHEQKKTKKRVTKDKVTKVSKISKKATTKV